MSTSNRYIVGFVSSLGLTLTAFWLVWRHTQGLSPFEQNTLVVALIVLAVGQLFVQLICFLHLGDKDSPSGNTVTLLFALFIVTILVGGTIWIMYHLDHAAMEERMKNLYPSGIISAENQDD